jgi:hypothetical protein
MKQKIDSLEKHRGIQQNLQTAHKRQAEKQLEQIRKLEELERSLSQQLVSLGLFFSKLWKLEWGQ